jgi:glycosyltransferase involved in cell wall biosynthesis
MKNKICFVVSAPITIQAFLQNHIRTLAPHFDISLVGNFSKHDKIRLKETLPVHEVHTIAIQRNINIISDFKSLLLLVAFFLKNNFHVVHSVTPKAGLICSIASKLSGIKNRIHIFTGQVWHTKKGSSKRFLILLDKVIVSFCSKILIDGESQRQHLIQHHIIGANNSYVLGKGSISGVDLTKFIPDPEIKKKLRTEFNISPNKTVFVFLGRFNKDKGIPELFEAFNHIAKNNINAHLILIGFDEAELLNTLDQYPNIKTTINFNYYGVTKSPQSTLQIGDIFCLPSHREGFGTSVIEASALGLAIICSDTYGLQETIIEDYTGLRHKTGDTKSIISKMEELLNNKERQAVLGENGKRYIEENFSAKIISNHWLNFYLSL